MQGSEMTISALQQTTDEVSQQLASSAAQKAAMAQTTSVWGYVSKGLGVVGILLDTYEIYSNIRSMKEKGDLEKAAEELENDIYKLKERNNGKDIASGVVALSAQLTDFKEILENFGGEKEIPQ